MPVEREIMRVVATFGLLAALVASPCTIAAAAPVLPMPDPPVEEGDSADDQTNPEGAAGRPAAPAGIGNWTGVKIRPRRPRQDSYVRVLVRCPAEATDAIVAAKPFNPPGSRTFRTQLGVGMRNNRGFDKMYLSYDALLGRRRVTLKCVKVTMLEHPRRRVIELVSRSDTYVFVRRFEPGKF
ncbi:hypothetical protein [Nonomuraea sp. NPDC049758]|uniref:hypothetical protein n=1 Tax=Nonomuraea sp. NPDC049758 TaxID=3154360 RepID=UPI003428E5BB